LKNKIFNESAEIWNFKQLSVKMFRDEYPRYFTIQVQTLFNLLICTWNWMRSFLRLCLFLKPIWYTVLVFWHSSLKVIHRQNCWESSMWISL